jgi:O-antigen ligase
MKLSLDFDINSIPIYLAVGLAFSLPFSTPICSLFAVLLLSYFVASGDWSNKWAFIKSSKIIWFAVALFAWTLIAGLYAVAPAEYVKQDLFKYKKLLVVIPLLFYLTGKLKLQLVLAYLLGVFVLIGLSLTPTHGFIHLVNTGEFTYTTSFRIYITEGMHIALAFFILLLGFKEFARYRFYLGPLIAIVLIHSLFMNGRMALISMGLSLICFVLLLLPKFKLRLIALSLLAICFLITYQFSPLIQSRVERTIQESSQIFSTEPLSSIRLQYYQLSLKLFEKRPLIGLGPGAFKAATNSISKKDEFSTHLHTHNEYLTLLSQYGLIGLGLFLILVQTTLRQLLVNGCGVEIKIGIVAVLIFLLNALTDSMLYMEGFFFVLILTFCSVTNKPLPATRAEHLSC